MLKHTLPDTTGKAAVLERVRQLTETCWTPLRPVPTHKKNVGKIFLPAGVEVKGLPYSSTEPTDKFICENLTIDTFLSAAANPDSALYTKDLGGHRNSWAYFGIVCNGLVRYALNIRRRYSTKRWLDIPGMRYIAKPGCFQVEDLQLLDILYAYGQGRDHVSMITDILRDETGTVRMVEVSEAVWPSCKRECYTPEAFYEKEQLFGLCRYEYLDTVPAPEPITVPQGSPKIAVDYGNNANYFSSEAVVLSVFGEDPQEVRLSCENGPDQLLLVKGNISLSLEPDWYTATHVASGETVCFCVCRPEIQYSVKDGLLTVQARSTDPRSRVLCLDLREESRAKLSVSQLPPKERGKKFNPNSGPLAQVVELTEEEKETGCFARPIHPDARNFKVCFENPNGIWTHIMLPLYDTLTGSAPT